MKWNRSENHICGYKEIAIGAVEISEMAHIKKELTGKKFLIIFGKNTIKFKLEV